MQAREGPQIDVADTVAVRQHERPVAELVGQRMHATACVRVQPRLDEVHAPILAGPGAGHDS